MFGVWCVLGSRMWDHCGLQVVEAALQRFCELEAPGEDGTLSAEAEANSSVASAVLNACAVLSGALVQEMLVQSKAEGRTAKVPLPCVTGHWAWLPLGKVLGARFALVCLWVCEFGRGDVWGMGSSGRARALMIDKAQTECAGAVHVSRFGGSVCFGEDSCCVGMRCRCSLTYFHQPLVVGARWVRCVCAGLCCYCDGGNQAHANHGCGGTLTSLARWRHWQRPPLHWTPPPSHVPVRSLSCWSCPRRYPGVLHDAAPWQCG